MLSGSYGNLTWNANGTLAALGITDPFNAANQQTCNYGYDDLTRISSANCGSAWSQSFGYPDAFGNLTKSGSASWQPSYDPATNRMSSIPGFTCPGSPANCYDANGNSIADGLHTYAWDARGHPITIDGVGLTYDALGRMVEQNRSGSYTQILYGPTGGKLALMNGQTVSKGRVAQVSLFRAGGTGNRGCPDELLLLVWESVSTVVGLPCRHNIRRQQCHRPADHRK